MNNQTYKVGAKVRCVQSARSVGCLVKGGEYIVQDVLSSGNVLLEGVSATYWQPTRFVLVQDVIRVNARKGNVFKRILNWLRGVK